MTREPRVRMLDLERQHSALRDELDEAWARVRDSQRFIGGPEVAAFEEELGAWLEGARVVSCGSGTAALELALRAAGVKAGDRVLCPAFSFYATAGAIVQLGATPVFADIEPCTFNLDVASAEAAAAATPNLSAILSVDLYGRAGDRRGLASLAARLGVPLVVDSAQALGALDDEGRPLAHGSFASTLSFYPTKNLGALGDGGAVLCRDRELAGRLRRLANHGDHGGYDHRTHGGNSRLDALQAAWLRIKLRSLDAWTEARRRHAREYRRAFSEAGAGFAGDEHSWAERELPLVLPTDPEAPARHVHHQYVVRVPAPSRETLRKDLLERGIETALHYPRALHQQPALAANPTPPPVSLAECERAARECLALPIHGQLEDGERERVVAALIAACAAIPRADTSA